MLEQPSTDQPARPASPVIDMRDIPLGTLVHRAGLLTAEQLEGALAEGSASGKRLGEVLIERGLLEERQVAELIAGQKGLPFVELRSDVVDPAAKELLPAVAARQFGALAIALEDGVPVVAIADPADEEVVAFLDERLEGEYKLVVAPRAQIERAAIGAAPELASAPATATNGFPAPAPEEATEDTASPTESPAAAAEPFAAPAESPAVAAEPFPALADTPEAAAEPFAAPAESAPVAAEPSPAPAESPPAAAEPIPPLSPGALRLVLRLVNGELLELGTFDDRPSADASAAHVVQQLIAGEASGWLAFDGRYVRPGAIVSLDIV